MTRDMTPQEFGIFASTGTHTNNEERLIDTVAARDAQIETLSKMLTGGSNQILHTQLSVAKLREILKIHHEWHFGQGVMGLCKDDKGEWVEIDMGLEYSDSSLCERTIAALIPTDKAS